MGKVMATINICIVYIWVQYSVRPIDLINSNGKEFCFGQNKESSILSIR